MDILDVPVDALDEAQQRVQADRGTKLLFRVLYHGLSASYGLLCLLLRQNSRSSVIRGLRLRLRFLLALLVEVMHLNNVPVWVRKIPQRGVCVVTVFLISINQLNRWTQDEVDVLNFHAKSVAEDV